jgi:hypothetical protein
VVTAEELARYQALGRLGLGAAMLVMPAGVAGRWIGPSAGRAGPRVLTRALGARDVALGLGQLSAAGAGHGVRPWVLAGMLADGVDLIASARGRDDLPALGAVGVSAMAGASTALGAYLARELG